LPRTSLPTLRTIQTLERYIESAIEASANASREEAQMAECGFQGIIAVIVGAGAVILSQWIAGRWGLKHRTAEIYLSNKADAYAALFVAIHELIYSQWDDIKYAIYRSTFERAKMFASDEVRKILEGDGKPEPGTLSHAIELLRRSEDVNKKLHVQVHDLYRAMSQLSNACRRDVERLGIRL
jgi:hypothetical protein